MLLNSLWNFLDSAGFLWFLDLQKQKENPFFSLTHLSCQKTAVAWKLKKVTTTCHNSHLKRWMGEQSRFAATARGKETDWRDTEDQSFSALMYNLAINTKIDSLSIYMFSDSELIIAAQKLRPRNYKVRYSLTDLFSWLFSSLFLAVCHSILREE